MTHSILVSALEARTHTRRAHNALCVVYLFLLFNGVESTQNRVQYTSYFYCPVATATKASKAVDILSHYTISIHVFKQNFYDYSS